MQLKNASLLLLFTAKAQIGSFPKGKIQKWKGKMLQDKSKINNYDIHW